MKTRTTPGLKTQPPAVADRPSAEAFIRWCVREIGPGYHPDSRGADYEDGRSGEPSFTPDEARLLDDLHEQAFALLSDDEPYQIALEEVTALGLAAPAGQEEEETEGGKHSS